jgi:DNA-binding NarL/FixJ family response regulator
VALRQPVRVVLADDHDAFVEGLGMVLSAEDDLEIVALAGDGASTLQAVRTHHPDVLVVDTEMPGPAVTELVRLINHAEPATRVLLLAEHTYPAPTPPPGPPGMSRAASSRELAEAIRAVAAGFRVVASHPAPPRPTTRPAASGPAASGPAAPGPAGSRPAGRAAPQPRDPGAPEREGNPPPGWVRGAVHSPNPNPHSPRQSPHWAGPDGAGRDRPERDLYAELLLRSLSERERQVLELLARGYSNRRIAEACYLSLNTVRTHVQNVLVKLGVHSKLEAAALAVRQGLVRIGDHPI